MDIELGGRVRIRDKGPRTYKVLALEGSWAWVKWEGDDNCDSGGIELRSHLRPVTVEVGARVVYRNSQTGNVLGTVEAICGKEAWIRLNPGARENAKYRHITVSTEIIMPA